MSRVRVPCGLDMSYMHQNAGAVETLQGSGSGSRSGLEPQSQFQFQVQA